MADDVTRSDAQLSDPGVKPRLEFHPPDKLMIDDRYQRSVSTKRGKQLIARLIEDFYWPFFGVIIATDNGDGTFCVIDGQHRAEAARQRPDIHSVPVMVIEDMSLAEQAAAFVAINENRVRLNGLQVHHAKVRSGDATAVGIDAICRDVGLTIYNNVPSRQNLKVRHTMAVGAVYAVYETHGPDILRRVLSCMLKAYPDTEDDLRAIPIKAVAAYLATHADADDAAVVRFLGRRDSESWQEAARTVGKNEGITTVGALAQMLAAELRPATDWVRLERGAA